MTTFALDLSNAIEAAKKDAETIIRRSCIGLFSTVVEKSPVGNPDLWKANQGKEENVAGKGYVGGRFRNNWNCSIGSPDLSTTEEVDKTGSKAKAKIFSTVMSYTLSDQSIFLTNNLPYAQRLEDGHSTEQAPQGMVRLSILEFNAGMVNQQIRSMNKKAGV